MSDPFTERYRLEGRADAEAGRPPKHFRVAAFQEAYDTGYIAGATHPEVGIIDLGGDRIVTLPNPTPERVAEIYKEERRRQKDQFNELTPEERGVVASWIGGQHLYARRVWQAPLFDDVTIYLDAPPFVDALQKEWDLGADPSELAQFTESAAAGMIFGRHYSAVEPDGELGSTFVGQLTPITKQEFDQAKERGWHEG